MLAAPVRAIIELIGQLPRHHSGNPIVIDLGSTKTEIARALDALPSRFDPLGGHPMCGKETGGLAHAEAALFQGAPFAWTPLPRTSVRARSLAEQITRAVGAHPLWLDPETHDTWVAATSHLPYLLATALALATPQEAAPLIGPGFRSTTRLAGSDSGIMLDILATNRKPVLKALTHFHQTLDRLEAKLRDEEFTNIETDLAEAKSKVEKG